MCQDRTHLHLLFCFICCSFHPFCSWFFNPAAFLLPFCPSSATLPPTLHPLAFSCMYIFRSRVIKSALEGMCLNRISLIVPCPHHTTKTQIHTQHMYVCNITCKHKQLICFLSFCFLFIFLSS